MVSLLRYYNFVSLPQTFAPLSYILFLIKMIMLRSIIFTLIILGCQSHLSLAQTERTVQQNANLTDDFVTPPTAAKPRVWWHWMNGNITKEGIKKDLFWMKKIGIGGFQNFDASLRTPQIVSERLIYMTPKWKDAFKHAVHLADSLKLEMAIAGSPGWSVTGGPWVPPADGMKKYVWTETYVSGDKTFSGMLLKSPGVTGKFQNHKIENANPIDGSAAQSIPSHYADVVVIAFKLTPADKNLLTLKPKLTSSGGSFQASDLADGDLANSQYLPPGQVGEEIWIQYEFDTPQTVKAFTVCGANHVPLEDFSGGPLNRSLKVSDDGVQFREVAKLSGSINPQNTVSIPATTARFFRLTFKTLPPIRNPFMAMMGGNTGELKPEGIHVAEFILHSTDRIDQFEDKAGFTPWRDQTDIYTKTYTDEKSIEEVIDITSKMNSDGTLNWDVPNGNWCILRFGYSLTGRQNHPASPEATGLEVDKLDKDAVVRYMEKYLDMYKEASGGKMGATGLTHMILDSYEAGHMTWTASLPAEFKKRRGYEITKWIPVLTGRVVVSGEQSEKFLWDFRKTIGELIAENHYDVIGNVLHQRGLKRYTESHEGGRIYLADGMDVKRNADIPMSAMWTPGSLTQSQDEEIRSKADIRESASVAHIYGQNIVAAESMTAVQNSFTYTPEKLKRTADMEMASGVNRFVIHTSVHQPLNDKKPGLSLGPFGQWFTRHETWANQAKPWIDYLARSCYLLQQGSAVVDILYYYGENNNITQLCTESLPKLPIGYEFDFVNATALTTMIQVRDGKLVTPSGMTYSVLVLDESAKLMTVPILKKLKEFAESGVLITGVKPIKSPSLTDNPTEFDALVAQIWSNPNVSSKDAGELLRSKGIQADVAITNAKSDVLYVHRKKNEIDMYWLNSRSAEAMDA
jgi:hypothetical protein